MSHRRREKDQKKKPEKERCFICGKTKNLTRTPCCDMPICDDEDEYVMFSYARNSCYRNHDHYTLCSYHYQHKHDGDWQKCKKCREELDPEMYAYLGTNEYNHTKLKDPPKFDPAKCSVCGSVIDRAREPYTVVKGTYFCIRCGSE